MKEAERFRELLYLIETRWKGRMQPVLGSMGLIAGQPRVLTRLLIKDCVTQKELADACGMEPATLSRVLDKLEDMDYIIRKQNPGSRRSFHIALTPIGRQKAEAVKAAFKEQERQLVKGFGQKEIQSLTDAMERVYSNLKEIP